MCIDCYGADGLAFAKFKKIGDTRRRSLLTVLGALSTGPHRDGVYQAAVCHLRARISGQTYNNAHAISPPPEADNA